MSGTTVQWLGPGNWSATPAQPPPQQYDQWGRVVSGPGLGGLYNAVSAAQSQQQMPPNAPNLMGIGASGYDQWGRQAPQQGGAVAPQATDWSVAGQLARMPPTGPVAAGDPNDPYGIGAFALQQALAARGGGLLGNALSERGPGADQGAAGQGY